MRLKSIITNSIMLLLICVLTLNIAYGSYSQKYKEKDYGFYNIKFNTQALGNYQLSILATELPSKETLPDYSLSETVKRNASDYYTNGTTQVKFEVDNLPPDAWYDARNVVKVDVVFATGQLLEMENFLNYMDTFEAKLAKASNNFDVMVKKVETVKGGFSIEDADPETIYNFWDQCPNPNNYTLAGNAIINAVYSWNGYSANHRGNTKFNQLFVESESWDAGDFWLASDYAWHGCLVPSGYVFHYDLEADSAYILEMGNNVKGQNGAVLYKMNKMSGFLGKANDGGAGDIQWCANWGNAYGKVLAYTPHTFQTSGDGSRVVLQMENNRIMVYDGDKLLIDYTDEDEPILKGGIGLYAGCTVTFKNVQLMYDKTEKKTLGEAVQDVEWRDNSVRFVIHATDSVPLEYDAENENRDADLAYTVTKLYNANCYLVNLGTDIVKDLGTKDELVPNEDMLKDLITKITQADGTEKGMYYNNTPITSALDNSAYYIESVAKKFIKPSDWILVNTSVAWNTGYIDSERDVPLNFGEHDGTQKQPQDTSDNTLASTLGIELTHYYTGSKILAEKWRYRHFNYFFDNSEKQESYHNIWIDNPVEIFTYPGKYRINYKRKDNPLYTNTDLTNAFDNYRYWSTRYDYKTKPT